ncbi:glycoside hydrolase family 3 C-terminal domain-containing protein [Saccharopolyspora sp. HNM0986]|uniref:glycoside hydrolase family 3 C-terminal domain-containing protein n=1 Tax=Saccharopolyspora galaxeae TaxID=2781241 RepID=UPI00190CC405|nr:glycoside hydrolase family 3 C-terminal domain-containing protein [Saccharopolyspora sp. HNM0986]MBK0869508.1 glycoside hydrolase family 3 C-terminal domain-containing protein [Saccharopolyspora sp. HNM0986]
MTTSSAEEFHSTALTLDEKIALLDGSDFWHTESLPRLGIPSITLTDGPHGLRKQPEGGDHLGIGDSVPATCFPTAAALACSWDVDLLGRVGAALGRECRAEGVSVLLGPGVNMKRTPLCGRNFEYFAEDPLLAGHLAAALVEGVQAQGVGTSLKHFAVNNQETERMSISAEVDERTLREIYLTAFEHVVTTARPWTVMSSYNRINGVYASENRWLLTDLLRGEWGFDGLVVSDWGAVSSRDDALRAGLDLEMPTSGGLGGAVVRNAYEAGTVSEDEIDLAVQRLLRLVERTRPALREGGEYDSGEHHALAREAAAGSAVLLKNDDGILPLQGDSTVAVLGELARAPRYQGAGSSQVVPTRLDDALSALRAALPGEVPFAPGYSVDSGSSDGIAEAVEVAARADVAVLFLGLPPDAESEGFDRDHLDLPAEQLELLHAVAEVQERIVVVLAGGSVVTVDPWQQHAKALLHGWLPGQAGGAALADVLTGAVTPSGKLAETIPVRYADTPAFGNFPGEFDAVRYGEGPLIGYRWYDARGLDVSYPFGHGLSYTSFEYRDLDVRILDDGPEPSVRVEFTVANTGGRAGSEVAQLYVGDPVSAAQRPEQELKAFRKVALEPGASQRVSLELGSRAFAYWHTSMGRWVVEGGEFVLHAGTSSRDIRLRTTIELTGETVRGVPTPGSELGTWLDHPVLGPRLLSALGGGGMMGELVSDPQLIKLVRAIPAERMTRFPGVPVTAEMLHEWSAEARSSPA